MGNNVKSSLSESTLLTVKAVTLKVTMPKLAGVRALC